MTTAIAIRPKQLPIFPEFTNLGYRGSKSLTLKTWGTHGDVLSLYGRALAWAIGDWIVTGEDRFGEEHSQYLDAFSKYYDIRTLGNYANVARAFPMEARNPRLSFSHHDAVKSLEAKAAQKWLAKAEKEEWSVKELRDALKGDNEDEDGAKAPNLVVERTKDGDIVAITARISSLTVKSQDKSTISLVIGSRAFEIVGSGVTITESQESEDAA